MNNTTTAPAPPALEPLAYSLDQLTHVAPLSRRGWERHVASGALRSVKIGGKRLVLRTELLRFLRAARPVPTSNQDSGQEAE